MRVSVLNTPVDALSFEETIDVARHAMATKKLTQQVSLNVAKLVGMRRDEALKDDVLSSDIISADGAGIVVACKLLGTPAVERVAGIDLMESIFQVCASEGYKPYLLGATPEVIQKAVERLHNRFPKLRIAGFRDGYFDADAEESVVSEIRSCKPDCLFIGMPTPKKERFLARHKTALEIPYIMGVGGSFDIVAGKIVRAPLLMQRMGLEWLFRVMQEPRRMWWRYLNTNSAFLWLLFTALLEGAFKTRFGLKRGSK